MQSINKFKLNFLIAITTILQIIINNQSSLCIDGLGIIIVILLITNLSSFTLLVCISFIADLIGHWYLGSHLLALLLLSFLTPFITKFFSICNILQKIIILLILFAIFTGIIELIDIFTHNITISITGFLIEILIVAPIIMIMFNYTLIKNSENFIL